MVDDLVTDERLQAGRDYLDHLKNLGLRLEGAFWSTRKDEPDTLELSLFSAAVDTIGTKRIYDVLFEAYHKAQTPKNFDPWQVAVYSPDMAFFKAVTAHPINLDDTVLTDVGMKSEYSINGGPKILQYEVVRSIPTRWIYFLPNRQSPSRDAQIRSWRRFEKQVALAA